MFCVAILAQMIIAASLTVMMLACIVIPDIMSSLLTMIHLALWLLLVR